MSTCYDCFRREPNRELEATKQAAQKYANEHDESQAIYSDGGSYGFISAEHAYANGYNVISVVSPHH
jgi:hypothetical protein